jgi:hypothetical protein
MPLSELPALEALLSEPSSSAPDAGLIATGRPKRAGVDLPCCPKCALADRVELEGRSGACGLWFRCERCDAMFFGHLPTR